MAWWEGNWVVIPRDKFAVEVIDKFDEKCSRLGGDPHRDVKEKYIQNFSVCDGLPSPKEAMELRRFVGELLKSPPKETRLFLSIEIGDCTEYITTIGGKIGDRVVCYKLRKIPDDLEGEMWEIKRKRKDISVDYLHDLIHEETDKRLRGDIKNMIRRMFQGTGFKESGIRTPWDFYSIRVEPRFRLYKSSEEFLRGEDSVKRIVEGFSENVDAVLNARDKIMREVVSDLKKRILKGELP
mgnify:CR=1 FL=1